MTAAVVNRTAIRRDVERVAEIVTIIRPLLEELDALKAKFREFGDGEYLGKDHKIVVSTATRVSLDTAKVKARLAPADYAVCTVTKNVTSVLVKEV